VYNLLQKESILKTAPQKEPANASVVSMDCHWLSSFLEIFFMNPIRGIAGQLMPDW
jgi:hypothetical protein